MPRDKEIIYIEPTAMAIATEIAIEIVATLSSVRAVEAGWCCSE